MKTISAAQVKNLILASKEGNLKRVKELITYGVPVDAMSEPYCNPALHYASSKGHIETVKYLVEQGSNVLFKDKVSIYHQDIIQCCLY
jgi:ankyrin repeat protein